MAAFIPSNGNDIAYLIGPGTGTVDFLGGWDILDMGTSLRSSYTITQGTNGAIKIDTLSGASAALHLTVSNLEEIHFNSGKDTYYLTASAPYLTTTPPVINGTAGNDNLAGTSGADTINGLAGNDTITGGAGNDVIDGGAGIDTAIYSAARSNYTVTHGTSNLMVKAGTGTDGTDTLTNIERLQFSDTKLAIDLGVTQSGGEVALLLDAVLGKESLGNKALAGQLLTFFDAGNTMHDAANVLVSAGIMDQLAGGSSTGAYVNLIFHAVTGGTATPDVTATLGSFIDSGAYSKADFLTTIADMQINQDHVGLVGLAQTGLEFS